MRFKNNILIERDHLLDRDMTVDWLRRRVVEYVTPPIFNDTEAATEWLATLPDDAIVDDDVQDPLSGKILMAAGKSKSDVQKNEV